MARATVSCLPPSLPPRGLSREQAAEYIGVGVSKFDEMVKDGRMPRPKRIDGRIVWDLRKLDTAFDALDDESAAPAPKENPWDGL
jgi:excisionase family DNA binding protein